LKKEKEVEDVDVIKRNLKVFRSVNSLLGKGAIDEEEAVRIAGEMGLKHPEKWLDEYKVVLKWNNAYNELVKEEK